jgi:hypothetical protein
LDFVRGSGDGRHHQGNYRLCPFQLFVELSGHRYSIFLGAIVRAKASLKSSDIVAKLLGAAAGHLYQMVTEQNFAPGNAGIIFYMDIVIPLFGILLLWFQQRDKRVAAVKGG